MRWLIFLMVLASSGKVFSSVIERNTAIDNEGNEDGIEFLEEGTKLTLQHRVRREEAEAKEEEGEDATETPDAEAKEKSSEKEEKEDGKKGEKEDGKKGEKKGEKEGGKKGAKKGGKKNPMKKMHHHFVKSAKKGANAFADMRKDPTKIMDFQEHAETGLGMFG